MILREIKISNFAPYLQIKTMNMKRLIIAFTIVLFAVSPVSAQQEEAVFTVVGESTHDFKTIKEADGEATHTFTIKNEGKSPLVISKVTSTCSCTTAEFSKEPIASGSTAEIKVIYDPANRIGPFTRTVSVYSNGSKGTNILTIKGNVE